MHKNTKEKLLETIRKLAAERYDCPCRTPRLRKPCTAQPK